MIEPRVAIINDQPRHSGTGVYAWHLVEELRRTSGYQVDHVYLDYHRKKVVINPDAGNAGSVAEPVLSLPIDVRPLFWKRAVKKIAPYDLYHFTSQNMSFLLKDVGGRKVLTCLDIIPYIQPERPFEKWWRRMLYAGMASADKIITISDHTRKDLARHFNIDSGRVAVIYLAADRSFRQRPKDMTRDRLKIPRERAVLLHVGTSAKRKRLDLLFHTVKLLLPKRDVILYRVGATSPRYKKLVKQLGLEDHVVLVENAAKEALVLYYNAADALVFPSDYEGFGLPVLEAMASGCPVITSDKTSLPEVAGTGGIMLGSDDPKQWALSIEKLLADKDEMARWAEAGLKQASTFDWHKTALLTDKLYRELIDE
jgi:glycosyltransferase involved in cell wall biosynthesis